ncbi:beta-ketoacyl-ACP synthase III [Ketobacter alkanivorans]|uniref:Beta-ketoacyl-ACP synthase III n=1 Tax=Ketobacter alkanivorans TaxID=1917421 RepID=A0A2K9LQP7_9GAMM|nr:beta-ketoacyl-ACP synthase III [Ketobacter alkanivorans]
MPEVEVSQTIQPQTVVISGTGLYTPQESVSNAELVACFNQYVDRFNEENSQAIAAGELEALSHSSEEFILKASGIESRYVMNKSGVLDPAKMRPSIAERSDEEQSIQCEIAVAAAKEALAQANKTADDIDAVIVACSNMQRAYPAMAIEVQDALGIKGFGFDMNVACSSATFGLQTAKDAVLAGSARAVLVLNPEICSGHLAWEDRDCHFIFGDVCTAMIVERLETSKSPENWEIMGSRLQTQFSNNIRNNFGFLNRCDESGIGARDKLFRQNGRKVFKEVVPMVAEMIVSHLSDESVETSQLKRMWLHQANLSMNLLISKKVLGRDATAEEAPVILNEYANTSSAGSVIAFHKHRHDFAPGEVGVICSFGAGYSAGSVIVKRC